jgi:hypothetical protein
MTKEEIIEIANQAKLPYDYVGGELMWLDKLEHFAKLIAEKEREACALMVMPLDESLADEIRARKQK